jgi:hypothetical protein
MAFSPPPATARCDRLDPAKLIHLGIRVKRREFVSLLGGGLIVGPLAARAQQPTVPVIGFLSGAALETMQDYAAAFQKGS